MEASMGKSPLGVCEGVGFGLSCCGGAEVHEFELNYLLFSF